mgnify:FL=1
MRLVSRISKNSIFVYFALIITFIFNIRTIVFPTNYQQDDVAELEPIFFESFICAFDWGDQHPLFSGFVWTLAQLIQFPEYLLSFFILSISLLSVALFHNILSKQFDKNIALLGSIFLVTSPTFITYSVSLKQYSFEIFCSLLCLKFLQERNKDSLTPNEIVMYVGTFTLLFLFSFVNGLVIFILLLFLLKEKNLKLILSFSAFGVLLFFFQSNLLSKIQRVSQGGYWDDFFLNTSSIENFFSSFYFLNQLFVKSIISLFIHPIMTFILFVAILVVFVKRNNIVNFSFVLILSLYFLSSLRLYPLGGGRTDIIFLPFGIILIVNLISFFINDLVHLKNKRILLFPVLFFLFVTVALLKPYYKNENITPLLNEISGLYNNPNVAIVTTEEQSHAFLYYSQKLFDLGRFPEKGCSVRLNIENLFIQKDNENLKVINKVKEYPEVVLIGIELPNTNGQYRIVSKQLLKENYYIVDEKLFPGYVKAIYFDEG